MINKLKFILFSLGLGTAIGSAITSIMMLYISMLGGKSIVYEPNFGIAFIETLFLILSIGTCLIASEVYYEYLEMKTRPHTEIYND
ncbi:MAG: hypothetical protein ACUVTB_04065 [Candidatus Bathycorpusculaceae bacterium]